MNLTGEQKADVLKVYFGAAAIVFFMNFIIRAFNPAITWDYALVQSAEFTFWYALLIPGLATYGFYKFLARKH